MKKFSGIEDSRFIILIIVGLILHDFLFSQNLFCQQFKNKAEESDVKNFREELYIQTDRDIYISGEQVWFKVYQLNRLTHSPWNISKVVYLELLDNNNFPLKQLKVKTDGNSGSSVFILPENISSGNYVIRAYTNWMKNWPVDFFCYKTISVINPFENINHLKLSSESMVTDTIGSFSRFLIVNKNENGTSEKPVSKTASQQINYTITLQKPVYSSREKIKLVISAADITGYPLETDLSVSVAKSGIVNSTGMDSFNVTFVRDVSNLGDTLPVYMAELEGHLLSGYMRLKSTDEPLKKTDVSLSYVGKTARCRFGKTDENGEFNFLIKETGVDEIVIQPLSSEITGYYVELIQPFSSSFSKYRPAPFYLDSSKISQINNAVISMQINNIYEPFRQKRGEVSKNSIPDFYGEPENTIKMSDYIELTSLREVVKEIIPNVYTLKQNGKYDFKLINKFRGQPFENKPLVLVDGVPMYDFEKVLTINSKEIERADIINTRYFYSENVFDGIISFITKKGNLSAMEFDNSIFRQAYEACQVQNDFYSPDYSSDLQKNTRIPDYRNTLYWAPSLETKKDGKREIEFFASDESAEYTIVVEGISSDGRKGFSTAFLVVK
ncbi:MAG: hypothetical protein WCS03_04790 [Bacteroidota bacterium]